MNEVSIYQLIQWKHAIILEGKGMQHSSGRSVTAHAKKHLSIKGNREKVLAAVEDKLKEMRDARMASNTIG